MTASGRSSPLHWGATFYWTGVAQVVAGGLVAAVTSPLDLPKGSWLAAYLVLVGGVTQCTIGRAQEVFGTGLVPGKVWSPKTWEMQYAAWNIGNLLVIVGSLTSEPYTVDAGGLLLLSALVIAVGVTRNAASSFLLWAYRAVLLLLVMSMPIGLALAHLRA